MPSFWQHNLTQTKNVHCASEDVDLLRSRAVVLIIDHGIIWPKNYQFTYHCMILKQTKLTNPTMHLSHTTHIPQYISQNSNVKFSNLHGVLWDMGQVHYGSSEIGLFFYIQCWWSTLRQLGWPEGWATMTWNNKMSLKQNNLAKNTKRWIMIGFVIPICCPTFSSSFWGY